MNYPETPFDAVVGGADNVSASFSLFKFAEPRMEEILMLTEALNDEPTKGLVFQRLPKHMRRRQMSHHQSRLPRRCRSFPSNEKKVIPTKRPSRKYRRKPSNLLTEYNRRKRNKIWLETHIWHAKRFHMTEKWGYKLAERPTNKSFRANYRAIRSHCLLVDVSYMSIIELVGTEQNLAVGLKKLTNSQCGLSFMARAFTEGSKEGSTTVFHPNSYPNRVIGNVSFLWKPKTADDVRKLWIWVHPSFHDEILKCFIDVFLVQPSSEDCQCYKSDNVCMTSLKDKMNRFKLVGPLSSCIIADALKMATEEENATESVPSKKRKLEKKDDHGNVGTTGNVEAGLEKKAEMLAGLSSRPPCLYPSGATLGLRVLDPRMISPAQRTKSVYKTQGNAVENWMRDVATSSLWSEAERARVSFAWPSDWQVSQIRSQWLVPEMLCQHYATAVPIILIQQPGNGGFGAGWDVIVPSNWGMTFWRSFVLRGARTGGLRENRLMKLEMLSVKTSLQPDSVAGDLEEQQRTDDLQERYFKLPPAKRPNFIKLGVYQPFSSPWQSLFDKQEYHVIRDVKLLMNLSECLRKKRKIIINNISNGLVAISLKCVKGKPELLARIALPKAADFKQKTEIEEPVHEDWKKPKRIEIRQKNKELLKKWKRDRIKQKAGEEAKWKESDIILLKKSSKELMRANWLLDAPVENARNTIGFVTNGDFQHCAGVGLALGYITLSSLVRISEISIKLKCPPIILLRNVNHLLYRKASFQILLD